uniref:Uncharacterized protein n=1 Tax=Rhizophora mucronata TaxID=61149 RepID=A0A2P2QM52_RHIMU
MQETEKDKERYKNDEYVSELAYYLGARTIIVFCIS